LRWDVVPARAHRPDEYREFFEGYRAIRIIDESGRLRGELVWRLATGQTVEITELGIFDDSDRRQGWGTRLLEAGLAEMRAFFSDKPYSLRRVYLFCESINEAGRTFYAHQGFVETAVLEAFYDTCDGVLYVLDVTNRADQR
jgi:ribosomal protein S18 acetylase RimI-like enzyme